MTTHGMEITFGIEIECAIPKSQTETNFKKGTYRHGIQVNEAPRGWECKNDASVAASMPGYVPVEVVSPILSGLDGLSQAAYMAEYLNEVSAEFNRSGGMHIHVGVPSERVTLPFMDRLLRLYKRYERAFYALNGAKVNERFNSTYCKPWNGNATAAIRGSRRLGLNLNLRVVSKSQLAQPVGPPAPRGVVGLDATNGPLRTS